MEVLEPAIPKFEKRWDDTERKRGYGYLDFFLTETGQVRYPNKHQVRDRVRELQFFFQRQ